MALILSFLCLEREYKYGIFNQNETESSRHTWVAENELLQPYHMESNKIISDLVRILTTIVIVDSDSKLNAV